MADLNLSTNGPSISRSYQSIVDAPIPSGPASTSPTYGQWAVFSVTAPLISAFQQGTGKESVLKVESTGEGELQELIDDFSDGRIQFAFLKIKDPNSGLRKNVLIGWCGEGVPERTKGYFSSHQAAVAKLLHGYHVQLSARSDRDLTPEGILQKVADASGAKYSSSEIAVPPPAPTHPGAPAPAKKPVFTPMSSGNTGKAFNPLASRRTATSSLQHTADQDGWGDDAPPVTRTQLEQVEPAYRPTKVDIAQLRTQAHRPLSNPTQDRDIPVNPDVVKGGYQPVGKVDIAAIRKQAAASGQLKDERPSPVKGAYEPVGKVNIADIKSRSQPSKYSAEASSAATDNTSGDREIAPQRLGNHSGVSQGQGRLSEMPKPKIANRFGSSARSFGGTKAPAPGEFGLQSGGPASSDAPIGPGRSFAGSAGKSPAQIWAEKKASQGIQQEETPSPGSSSAVQPIPTQSSGGWKSGYEGKKWATVQTNKTAASASSVDREADDIAAKDASEVSVQNVGAARDRFAQEETTNPPSLNVSNKPSIGGPVAMPGLPSQSKMEEEDVKISRSLEVRSPASVPPRSPSPDNQSQAESPVRIALPVARGSQQQAQETHDDTVVSHPPVPEAPPLQATVPQNVDEEQDKRADSADMVSQSPILKNKDTTHNEPPQDFAGATGHRAVAQYDYEKAEDNELELKEGETIVKIEMVDPDWWMGQNSAGETGLFPSNFVELVEEDAGAGQSTVHTTSSEPPPPPPVAATSHPTSGSTAIAQYDYEAAEDNELSFPEGAKITNVEFPDEDWWSGEYNGSQGLFPSNYVELEQ